MTTAGLLPGGDVLVITPSRERAGRLAVMIAQTLRTARARTAVAVCCDEDDPQAGQYEALAALHAADPRIRWHRGPRQTLAGWTNQVAASADAQLFRALASLGDDHLPGTDGWDELLLGELAAQGGGLAYGNDLHQGAALPTAPLIDTRAVAALGWMCLPGCGHYFIDDAWRRLYEAAGLLAYRGDVITEHAHPDAGKAAPDRTYADAVHRYWAADHAAYLAWSGSPQFGEDLAAVLASAGRPVPA